MTSFKQPPVCTGPFLDSHLSVMVTTTGHSYTNPGQNDLVNQPPVCSGQTYWSHGWPL